MKQLLKVCMVIMAYISMASTLHANALKIEDKGIVGSSYSISLNHEKMMLSRDGKKAEPIATGDKVDAIGTYFLSYMEGEVLQIQTFEIAKKTEPIPIIDTPEALEEVLKSALEKGEASIPISISSELTNQQTFTSTIEKIMEAYPVLFKPKSWEATYKKTTKQVPYKEDFVEMQLAIHYTEVFLPPHKSYTHLIKEKVIQIIEENIQTDMTEVEREIKVLEYLTHHVAYSKTKEKGIYPPVTHTIYGALINEDAVCDGYAEAFMYLMNVMGVPVQIVIGQSNDIRGKGPHEWNIISIEGENYHVDPTWIDKGMTLDKQYMNQTDYKMRMTHTWDEKRYPLCTSTRFEKKSISLDGNDVTNLLYSGLSLIVGVWMIISVIKRLWGKKEEPWDEE